VAVLLRRASKAAAEGRIAAADARALVMLAALEGAAMRVEASVNERVVAAMLAGGQASASVESSPSDESRNDLS
jgi:hypothetical protein